MKKTFTKTLIALVLLFSATAVYADGMIFKEGSDFWELATEDKQYCAISYQDGIQNMMLTVDPGNDFKGEKAVWLFPVPALPEETSINIFDKFPSYYGQDILIKARSSITKSILSMRFYHYLAGSPLFFVFGESYLKRGIQGRFKDAADDLGEQFGVTIHEHMEKEGLTTELLSAKTASGLYDYFKSKGLDFNPEAKSILDGYIGSRYSFVATWISNLEKYYSREKTSDWRDGRYGKPQTVSVFISFPSERLYFPLKPTSIYADAQIPIEIYVEGYVVPKLYPEIKGYVSANYFHRSYSGETKDAVLRKFLFDKNEFNKRYTKIGIQARSSSFVDDLWMDVHTPQKVRMAETIDSRTPWMDILTYLLISCIASVIAGRVIFRRNPVSRKKLLLVGFANALTILGFSIVAYRSKLNRDVDGVSIPNKITLNQCAKRVGLIALVIVALIVGGFSVSVMLLNPHGAIEPWEVLFLLIPTLILYVAIFVFIFPFVWGWHNDRRSLVYIILFSAIFISLTAILEIGITSLL